MYPSDGVLYGPLISKSSVLMFENAIKEAVAAGGTVQCGGKVGDQVM